MVALAFSPSNWKVEAGDLYEFEASVVYILQIPGQPKLRKGTLYREKIKRNQEKLSISFK